MSDRAALALILMLEGGAVAVAAGGALRGVGGTQSCKSLVCDVIELTCKLKFEYNLIADLRGQESMRPHDKSVQ